MKHIFKIIDQIAKIIQQLPSEIQTPDSHSSAQKQVDELYEDSKLLGRLLESQQEKKNLDKLIDSHIDRIEGWSEEVVQILDNLVILNQQLIDDIGHLKYMLKNNSGTWSDTIESLRLNVLRSEFIRDEGQIHELRKTEIFDVKQLRELLDKEEEVAKLLD